METAAVVDVVRSEIHRTFDDLRKQTSSHLPVILAVSGGPDSVCMADAVWSLADSLDISATIAHLNHSLRGEAARVDAQLDYVLSFAAQRSLPCVVGVSDVGALAREQKLSIELAARLARYQFLASTAAAANSRHIFLAHTSDDHVETVLLRFLRGTGINGLRGIRKITVMPHVPSMVLVRPLLSISRTQVNRYCLSRQLAPRHDESNDDLSFLRNRVRHELLPILETYNPGIRQVLTRLADTATSDSEIIEQATQDAYSSVTFSQSGQSITFDRIAWRRLRQGLQRATLREAVREIHGNITELKYAGIIESCRVLNSDIATAQIAIMSDIRIVVTTRTFEFVGPHAVNTSHQLIADDV